MTFQPALLLGYAAPVAYAAIGEAVVERAGVIHIGLEGAMLASAFAGFLATDASGSPALGLAAGAAAGLASALLFGWLTVARALDQVVVGTAVNLLALGVTGSLFRERFGKTGKLLSIPRLPTLAFGLDAALIALFPLAVFAAYLLGRTGWGLAARAAGEDPKAPASAGFDVVRLRLAALAFGGATAGIGGAYLSVGVNGSFTENVTAGRGFVAIAVVTFGRWRPVGVVFAALLIGLAESLQFLVQASGVRLPYQLMLAAPYLLSLALLALLGRGVRPPAALGRAYRRSS